ncbi:sterol carrier family protein [Streptomyces sp. NPDC057638]|uniref:sterol carrier family protein n=1 Tax=Streptomyces sp. NPDC057638 TaxID=3346190 RepID=UPI0036C5A63E
MPTRLGSWTVRELASHLSYALHVVVRELALPEPPKAELALLEWPFATEAAAGAIDTDVRALSAAAEPAEGFDRVALERALQGPGARPERPVAIRVGAMRLSDLLVTRVVELVVHTDDLNDATGLEIPIDRQALAVCTRLLADALAVKAPGGAVEVRVPPFAVVQCGEGPRHTRGTPPNVVETDPLTWIRLASGRTSWAEAREQARVSASGERADLGGLLPVMR